ncbi:threonine dehydrogenase-like Zn-dependent dehydrogenase [Tamaricihabitans halophyticus]|uniref:Threonine dehydrogenase-like Zn-dependent dehydrogenase n=1 Tax=Tamaricihabitans halophyticus TaxID=1262583 RepID=A0A4R2QUY3_9PSEU|nr:zinc-binding dehydrogenase [Tamaricihabitans halophyticus]TCP53074.1 threonine dehydrogenase-like Zn-dependent dehydrogenase [Tamaricihabitans halophyticus]
MTTETGTLAYMTEPGKLELHEYPVPEPRPGSLVMRTTRANVCGSELHIWNGKHPVKRSGGIGHEMTGVVAALGEGTNRDNAGVQLAVGDRIAIVYFQACERCFHCVRGEWNLCDNAYEHYAKQPTEWPHFHTAFATHYYATPRQHVYRVPDSVPDSVAAAANCALSQVIYGMDQAGFGPGQTILIQGAGGLGLYATAVAATRGIQTIVVDGVPARLEQARRFGANHTLDISAMPNMDERRAWVHERTEAHGPDGMIEVTGVPAAFAEGLSLIRRGGTYLVMGNLSPGSVVDYDPGLATRRALHVLHVDRYAPFYLKRALDFLDETIDRFPFDGLVDAEYPLERIVDALDASARREVTRASIVMP